LREVVHGRLGLVVLGLESSRECVHLRGDGVGVGGHERGEHLGEFVFVSRRVLKVSRDDVSDDGAKLGDRA
jgi:hypothetical protein